MDIPDIDIVVVYGNPPTISQLYQVYTGLGINILLWCMYTFVACTYSTKVKQLLYLLF